MTDKPILCLDFDGVIHSYTSGWKGPLVMPDPPVPGAIEFLRLAVEHFTVAISSSRSSTGGAAAAMRDYLIHHGADDDLVALLKFPLTKPPAFVTLDDRALTFDGSWPDIAALLAFKPWFKREAA